ncbi:hypothetical protein JCM16303_004539 [Sporobolomyces ruberrimus]
MLGSSTRNLKTYGKRKTAVINKRVVLGDANSKNNNNNNPVKSGGWSDSDSNEEEEIVVIRRHASEKKKVVPVVRVVNRKSVSQNKENSSASTDSTTRKTVPTKNSVVLGAKKEAVDMESSEESSDLPVRAPLRKKVAARPEEGKAIRSSRFARVVESEDEDEAEDEEIQIFEADKGVEEPIVLEDDSVCEAEELHLSSDSEPEILSTPPELREPSLSSLPFPPTLSPLLASTLSPNAQRPYDFASFVKSPLSPFAVPSTISTPWRKIGEASYSEVFSTTSTEGEDLVVKIIPVAPLDVDNAAVALNEDLPFSSEWQAVKREIEMSQWLGGDGERRIEGFVHSRGAFLVQGSYPPSLLASWDVYKSHQKPICNDQIRPSILPPTQLYALILLDHAGVDLESWKLRNWKEAREIWDQVVGHLGHAEREFEFEHRDLHWGNILIAPAAPPPTRSLPDQFAALNLTPRKFVPPSPTTRTPTVKATLIDFTLSRMLEPNSTSAPSTTRSRSKSKKKTAPKRQVLFDPFEDECIFEGEGDQQFDVYRGMRTVVEREGGGWEGFHPKTNLLWLHYLINKLLYSKKLKTPSLPPPPTTASSSSPFSSPGRAVSSPRKTRRHSLVFSSSSPLVTTSTLERKARTLPSSSMLLAKQQRMVIGEKQRKEMVEEVQAWESLGKARDKVEEVLRDLVRDGREGEKGVARSKVKKVAEKIGKTCRNGKTGEDAELSGASDFAKWWKGE